MKPSDFFIQIPDENWNMHDEFDSKLAQQLRQGELEDYSDLEAGYALTRLMKSELTAYGTDQSQKKLTDEDSALAIRSLKAVLRRLDVPFDPPFNDFDGWHGYWSAQGMTHGGSWALRRGYINELFTPVLAKLEELEDSATDTLGFRGVDGEMKNIIFASTSYKPEIILRDAISNTIEVVSDVDTCLVYNRALTRAGLTWGELTAWWRHEQNLDSARTSRCSNTSSVGCWLPWGARRKNCSSAPTASATSTKAAGICPHSSRRCICTTTRSPASNAERSTSRTVSTVNVWTFC
ncbi:hypothetical protein [Streptomyces kanamyceticus]|uniref:hypothetical protein n=1 Tax=Streptomyces kanamyceticus TaxID=1967 RepID=UPI0006E2E304|nr:hypothetical protein [Streptomyces kanamyceticus]